MKYIKYIIFCVLLYSCEPKEIEEKKYEWKDISIQSVNIDWRCIQMLDENKGFIGGSPKTQFGKEVSISEDIIISSKFSYNVDFTYQNNDIVPEPCLYKTTDGGTSWDIIKTPFRNGVHQICFIDNNIGYVSCNEGVYKTTDSGFSWKKLLFCTVYGKNKIAGGLYSLYFSDSQTGYANFSGITIGFTLKTTDGGLTWTLIDNAKGECIYQTNQIVYASTRNDLYKTIDNGTTWSKINVNDDIYDVYFYNSANFLVSTYNKIMETVDGGITWTSYNVPIKYGTKKMIIFNKEAYIIDAKYIYHFDDFSQIDVYNGNKYSMNREKEETLNGISFPNPKTGFAVGKNGMILKYIKE